MGTNICKFSSCTLSAVGGTLARRQADTGNCSGGSFYKLHRFVRRVIRKLFEPVICVPFEDVEAGIM
jgi:hypothetical protein